MHEMVISQLELGAIKQFETWLKRCCIPISIQMHVPQLPHLHRRDFHGPNQSEREP
jgi:hypothetical protein